MSRETDKMLTYIILILCFVIICKSLIFIQNQNKWSPIDEYSHMDYVDKLAEGHFPKLSDQISEELFQHIVHDTNRNVVSNIHSREQLGIGCLCYEALHPPLYHLILALPDWMMKKMGTDIFSRLKILRLCSYFLFVLGMCMCVPVFKALSQLGYLIPLSYAWGCVLFGLIIVTHQRYGLGNNMISPLFVNSAAYFAINYYIKPSNKMLYFFCLIACLAIFSSFSTIFIVSPLCFFLLKKYVSNFSIKNFIISVFIFGIFGILLLYWKMETKPIEAVYTNVMGFLTNFIPAGMINYKTFWQLLMLDAFTLSFIKEGFDINFIILLFFILSNTMCLVFIKTIFKNHGWILLCGIMFGIFLIATFILNKYIAAAHWMAFRHYLDFIPVWYVACTSFLIVLNSKYASSKQHNKPVI